LLGAELSEAVWYRAAELRAEVAPEALSARSAWQEPAVLQQAVAAPAAVRPAAAPLQVVLRSNPLERSRSPAK
jgi:hypothetical protein